MTEVSKHIILIVEDDPSLREGIHDLLKLEGDTDVYSVSNGIEALELLESVTPSLIISDIMMPLMNGFELLESVRKKPKLIRVPFVFLTAKGTPKEVHEGRKSGAEMYMTKPFDPVELVKLTKMQLKRAAEKQLASQEGINSLKRSVLQILNHEFRTPLTYVTAYYEMLEEAIAMQKSGNNVDDYLNGILSGCERLIDLIENLILVMDVRSNTLNKKYLEEAAPIASLNQLVDSVIQIYKPLAKKNNIHLHFHKAAADPLLIWGVENQLRILFSHLLENAVKFTTYTAQETGEGDITVCVCLTDDGNWVNVVVKDSGIGILKEEKDRVFELFYQHNRNYYEQQGSGVGLTIARGIANIHKGTLQIKDFEESGCTILLQLPVFKGEVNPIQPPHLNHPRKPLVNVLLVEDDEALLNILKEIMDVYSGRYRFETRSAHNGKIALDILEGFTPDLIISDLMMPVLNGFELLQAVREQSALLHVPFIITSGRNQAQDIFDGRISGAEEYITKPYDTEELMTIVEVQLNRYFEQKQVIVEDFDKFKQKILSMLQPDFRIPLQSVSRSSTLLSGNQKQINTAEELRFTLAEIQAGSQKISELVEDFMSLAEIETGEAQKAFKSRAFKCFDLSFLLSEAISYHKDAFIRNKISPKTIISDPPLGAVIEHSSMQKVLVRLLGIVTTFCIPSGATELTVEVKSYDDSNLAISVWHNGENLDEDTVNQINSILKNKDDNLFNPIGFSSHIKIINGFVDIHSGMFMFSSGNMDKTAQKIVQPDRFIITLPKIGSSLSFDNDDSGFILN